MKARTLFLLAMIFSAMFIRTSFAESALSIDNFWIAEAPPVSKVLAGYLHITNNSNQNQKIASAASKNFSKIEFHRSIEKNGMASMQHQEFLLIPAKGSLTLKPGDYHLMLFNPTTKLRATDSVAIHFTLENGKTISADAVVKKPTANHSHNNHH